MNPLQLGRSLALALAILTTVASTGSTQDLASLQRAMNSGEDRELDWSLTELFRIGPVIDGPAAFFRVFPWTIATDPDGRIYVLDVGDHRIAVFDRDGRHLRDIGRRGGGPGEFLRPVGLAVGADGVITVADEGKPGAVRFGTDGRVLEQRRLTLRLGPIGVTSHGLLVGERSGSDVYRLVLIADNDTTVLAETTEPGIVRFPDCPVGVPGRPFFAQTVRWATGSGAVVLNASAAYELSVYSGVEEIVRISRNIPAIEIEKRAALQTNEVRGGFEITYGSNRCKISPEELLEARGYARRMSPIFDIAMAPHGEIWVKRVRVFAGPSRIDILNLAGHYLGTVPEGFQFPTAFQTSDQFVVLRRDPDGVPFVVGYKVTRTSR